MNIRMMNYPRQSPVKMQNHRYVYFLFVVLVIVFAGCTVNNEDAKLVQNLSDKRASTELKSYYLKLCQRLNAGIMLGHQDDLAYGSMWYNEAGKSDVKSVCGKYPAVVGWDLGNAEFDSVLNVDSVPFSKIRQYVTETEEMNGITTFNWHCRNIFTNGVNDTVHTSIPESFLPGNRNHAQYLACLDRLGDFFLGLKDKDGNYIPVIFRPFDSATTTDLWWGACSPEEYKKLWQMTVHYLRDNKNVHHVLYAYSVYGLSQENDIVMYYPGDEYVDIVGLNIYLNIEEDETGVFYRQGLDSGLSAITQFAGKHKKIPALTDTGMRGIKISNFFSSIINPVISKYKISYILFGKNAWNMDDHYYIPIPGHPASEDFAQFANSTHIITCKN